MGDFIGGGGGGGAPGSASPLYKGSFATILALTTAFPTGQAGWFAYVGPDKYEWNAATTAWEAPLLQLTVEPNEVIGPGKYANAAGRQWLNDTAGNLTAPAILISANMLAAGFSDVTEGGLPFFQMVDGSDTLVDSTLTLSER